MNRRSPIARSLVVAGALVAAITLSSCSAFDTNNDVAVVGDQSLSQDDLQAMLESKLGQSALNATVVDGRIDANSARALIQVWVSQTVLVGAGVGSDVDRVSIESQLATDNPDTWDAAPQVMRDLYIDVLASRAAEADVPRSEQDSIVAAADVTVDSRYGRWDSTTRSVVGFD